MKTALFLNSKYASLFHTFSLYYADAVQRIGKYYQSAEHELLKNDIYVSHPIGNARDSESITLYSDGKLDLYNPGEYGGYINNVLSGYKIDLEGIGLATAGTVDATSNTVKITQEDGSTLSLLLNRGKDLSGYNVDLTSDGKGGTLFSIHHLDPEITFSEQPVGTQNPVYNFVDNKVTFAGVIVTDESSLTSPGIAANTSYSGPVTVDFQKPVTEASLDVGLFDSVGSTKISFLAADGTLLQTVQNDRTGFQTFDFKSQSGVGEIKIEPISTDSNGFEVDNLSFAGSGTTGQNLGNKAAVILGPTSSQQQATHDQLVYASAASEEHRPFVTAPIITAQSVSSPPGHPSEGTANRFVMQSTDLADASQSIANDMRETFAGGSAYRPSAPYIDEGRVSDHIDNERYHNFGAVPPTETIPVHFHSSHVIL